MICPDVGRAPTAEEVSTRCGTAVPTASMLLLNVISTVSKSQNSKNKNFKLVIKGELSLKLLNSFVSLDVIRDGNSLKLLNYEVIEKNLSKNN